MADAADVRALLLTINANTELLRSNLTAAEQAVASFQGSVETRLGIIDTRFAGLGKSLDAVNERLAHFVEAAALLEIGKELGEHLLEASKSALEFAAGLEEQAVQAGTTAQQLQVYRFAASQAGVSQEALETGLAKLNVAMGQARNGAKAPAAAFAELSKILGVDVLQSARQAGDMFPLLAAAMEKTTDSTKRFALERATMSRGGTQLDTLLREGAGALDEYAKAAETLGIVLSDKQIQDAHETANKLAAVGTELKVNFASVVADNAASILQLANAFGVAASAAIKFVGSMNNIGGLRDSVLGGVDRAVNKLRELPGLGRLIPESNLKGEAQAQSELRGILGHSPLTDEMLARQRASADAAARAGAGAGSGFLSGAGHKRPDHTLQDDHAFQGQLRQAQEAYAKAEAQLADSAEAQYDIQIQALQDAEQTRVEQVQDLVASKKITKARGDQLIGLIDQTRADEEILAGRRKEIADIDQKAALASIALEKAKTLDQLDDKLATTRKQHLELQLKILADEQAQLIAADKKALADAQAANNGAKIAQATAKLAADQSVIASGKQEAAIRQQNQGPLGQYRDQLRASVGDMNDALQGVEVDGLKSLESGLTDVITGTKSVAAAFKQMATSIIQDLIRIGIEKAILGAIGGGGGGGGLFGGLLGGIFGGGGGGVAAFGNATINNMGSFALPGLADGGPANENTPYLVGERGPELFVPNASGSIIPNHALRVPSMAGTAGGGSTVVINANFDARGASADAVPALRAEFERFKGELPARAIAAVKEAEGRLILRAGSRR